MAIGSRFSGGVGGQVTTPQGAPECWGYGYDYDDHDCRSQCAFRTSCLSQYERSYRGRQSGGGISIQRGSPPGLRHNNPQATEDQREETPLIQQVGHNMLLGAVQSAWDEMHDVIARYLGGIFRY